MEISRSFWSLTCSGDKLVWVHNLVGGRGNPERWSLHNPSDEPLQGRDWQPKVAVGILPSSTHLLLPGVISATETLLMFRPTQAANHQNHHKRNKQGRCYKARSYFSTRSQSRWKTATCLIIVRTAGKASLTIQTHTLTKLLITAGQIMKWKSLTRSQEAEPQAQHPRHHRLGQQSLITLAWCSQSACTKPACHRVQNSHSHTAN